jgi:hypothetical protein
MINDIIITSEEYVNKFKINLDKYNNNNINDITFNDCDFDIFEPYGSKTIFKNCTFKKCIIKDNNFYKNIFISCLFNECEFKNNNMRSSLFRNSEITNSIFKECNLSYSYFQDTFFRKTYFYHSDLTGYGGINLLIINGIADKNFQITRCKDNKGKEYIQVIYGSWPGKWKDQRTFIIHPDGIEFDDYFHDDFLDHQKKEVYEFVDILIQFLPIKWRFKWEEMLNWEEINN